jgi:hypothetical protein
MRFTVFYSRKVRTKAYEMLEIGLTAEFDSAITNVDEAFDFVKDKVNLWIADERDRILRREVNRGEA